MFGWLEVDEVLPVVSAREPSIARHPWITSHPHVATPQHYTDPLNSLYTATIASRYAPQAPFGAGLFPAFSESLQLTRRGATGRSTWALPGWFMPSADRPPLSYHSNASRWMPLDDQVELKSVAKGQEFVLDASHYPEATEWVSRVIQGATQ